VGLAELLPIAAGIAGAFWGVTHLSLPRLATFANDLDHRTWPVLRSPAAGRAAQSPAVTRGSPLETPRKQVRGV